MPLDKENEENEWDYYNNDNPKCPHCDAEVEISRHELYELYNDQDHHRIDCPFCEKEFKVISESTWTFHTDNQDED